MTTLLVIAILICAFYGINLTIKADNLSKSIPEGLLMSDFRYLLLTKKAVSLATITFILVVILAISVKI